MVCDPFQDLFIVLFFQIIILVYVVVFLKVFKKALRLGEEYSFEFGLINPVLLWDGSDHFFGG